MDGWIGLDQCPGASLTGGSTLPSHLHRRQPHTYGPWSPPYPGGPPRPGVATPTRNPGGGGKARGRAAGGPCGLVGSWAGGSGAGERARVVAGTVPASGGNDSRRRSKPVESWPPARYDRRTMKPCLLAFVRCVSPFLPWWMATFPGTSSPMMMVGPNTCQHPGGTYGGCCAWWVGE